MRRVRHGDLSVTIDGGDDVGLVVNLTGSHWVEGGAPGCFWSGRPRPGSSTVLPPGARYAFRIAGACSVLLMRLPLWELMDAAALAGCGPASRTIRPALNVDDPVLAQAVIEMTTEEPERDQELTARIAAHLLMPPATVPPRRAAHLTGARLRRVTELIAADPAAHLPLSMLAREAGMSLFAFARSFKASTNLSPHSYVTRRRLERAMELLGHRSMPLADVARSSGFCHVSHLARHLRRWTGTTPEAFRSRILP